ncbi:hypothetical protein [Mesorhizobium cantuariense]|uniref:Uncharacterized protein n=1 Tax=Mesorhizobium cantuariense TaxID=1300275 RepID=A0ABV7MHX3_9HYPH
MSAILDSKIVGLGGGLLGDTAEFLNLAYDAIKDAAKGDFAPLASVIANYGVSMVLSAVVITATIAIAGYFSAGAAAVVAAAWAVGGVIDAISNGAQLLEKILLDLGVLDHPYLPDWYAALNALFNPPPRDPLVIDLDGDGIELTSLGSSSAYFDLDGDGFAERTGWVGADDGLLVLDENGNGRIDDIAELFGSATSQGFQELSRLDSNHDNVIDANDAAFLSLQVWRDANGDGVSAPDELHSLNELGIRSLSLEASVSGASLSGNRVLNTSHVTWSNGAQTQSAEIVFTLSQFQSRYVLPENFAYDADVYDLPKLAGYGDLADLWVAMTQDGSLKAEAEAAIETARSGNFGEFLADMDDFLFDWAGVEGVRWMGQINDLYVHFAYDAGELAEYLEDTLTVVYSGGSGPTPPAPKGYVFSLDSVGAAELQAWLSENDLALPPAGMAGSFRGVMLNSTLPTITVGGGGGGGRAGNRITLSLNDLGNQPPPDPTSIMPAPALAFLQKIMGQDYRVAGNFLAPDSVMVGEPTAQNAVALMKSFSEVRDYYTSYFLAQAAWSIIAREGPEADLGALAPFKNIFVNPLTDQIDGDFRSLMLQVVDMFRVQDLGSDLDALTLLSVFKGEAPIVALAVDLFDDIDNATIIEAFDLNAIIDGTVDADSLSAVVASVLAGHGGNDTLTGSSGNDTLLGGEGNDALNGGTGNDTYVFDLGDGTDTISDSSGKDWLLMGAGLTAANVTFNVSGSDLLITYGAGDQIRLVNQYYWASTSYQVETLMYGDGTTISLTGGLPIVGGTGNDILNGTAYADTLTGGAGTDTLNGNDGNDTLNGGIANDVLNGGSGNDTYVFSSGDGTDIINENSGSTDTIQLGAGLTTANVFFNVSGSDLLITYGGGDQIRLVNQYYWASPSYQVETLVYGDGTAISLTAGLPIVGGAGNDTLNGTAYADTLTGGAGTDTLNGNDGNDTLNGGIANDVLNGGSGNDTYVFNSGDGSDTINENSGAGDTIQLGAGLTAANVFFNVSGSDLLISYGAGDQIKLADQYYWASTSYQVETLIYGDGTTISLTGGLPIVGGTGNDTLNGTNGNNALYGLVGDDTLNGNDGDDVLTGGVGSDVLNGGSGNDTYAFSSGDGADIINDNSGTADTIRLGAGLTAANVFFNVSGSDLLISYGAGDQIKLVDQYYWASTSYQVETLMYGDGTTISLTGGLPIVGGTGNDTLNGTNFADTLTGGAGTDTLNGNDGNDTLNGGIANDVLNGGNGNDTYVFSSGDGTDTINENSGAADTIQLGAGLTAANVTFNVSGSDLLITYSAGDQIRLVNQYYWASTSYQVETLIYGDGITISLTAGLPIVGGTGNDILNGTNFADTLTGGAGTDTLNGNDGNDTLNGGIANDVLNGGNGNDTYVFSSGDGTDTINENSGAADTIQLGAGLTAANVTFNVSGSDLLITYGAGDQIRLVNQYYWASTSYQVETLIYGDGITISLTAGLPIVGGTGNDILNGTNFADTLTDGAGTDTLNGNDGNDTLNGGIANDVLNGGSGNDTYVFNSGDGSDTINENSGAADTIQLGAGLTAANVTFNVSGSDLLITYGAGDQIRLVNQYYWASTSYQIETLIYGDGTTISLTGGLPIVGGTGNDILNGTNFADTLTGGAGTDTLNGNDGNDTLNGGIANDVLNGGSGNDTYVFNSGDGSDTINENSGAADTIQLGAGLTAANVFFNVSGSGNDLLISDGVGGDLIKLTNQYYSAGYQIETLIYGDGTSISLTGGLPIVGGAGNDTLNGTGFGDTLSGGDGTDTLNGYAGNDTLTGGIGTDALNGGSGNDTYVFNSGDGSDTIYDTSGTDTIQLGAGLTAANVFFNVSGSGNDLLISDGVGGDLIKLTYQYYSAGYQIETLIYGDGTSISLTGGLPIVGGAGNDTLNGTGFGDTLSGGDGTDTLNGYAGNDTLTGGIGTDALNGGSGNDTYVFNSGDGSDTVYDTGGTDTIQLGAGLTAANVFFNVSGSGNDLLISDGVGGDLIKLTNQYYSAGYQIETLIYGDGTSISLTGGLPIVGGAGNDTLNGTGFGDTLSGGDGTDTLNGYAGNDTLTGGIGTDALNGGSGNDTYVFNSGDGSDTVYDTGGTDTIQLGAGLTAANVFFNVSGSGNDLLISDGVGGDLIKLTNQYYSAGYQIETLIYGDGTSISLTGGLPIVGGAGNDTLNGTGFGDTLSGGDGTDTLNGYAGNDTLTGGIGTDALNGGSGNDTYVFNSGDGSDTVYDTGGTDTIQLGAGLTAANVFFNVSGSGNDLLISDGVGGDLIKLTNQYYSAGYQIETLIYGDGTSISLTGGLPIVGGAGNDTLNGGSAKEALYGFDGDDTLNGSAGGDTLTGGAGNDTFIFQAGFGKDTIIDFTAGAGSPDIIQFANTVFDDFASVLAVATQVGADTVITHDSSNVLTLKNVALANLHQDDFQFIAA